jgi:AcrR family transcriptional regulator
MADYEPESRDDGHRPKFRRRADKRPDELLDAALALFAENGYSETRIEDVAARAGVSKGAVYHYFPSKRALLQGLIRRAVVPVAEGVAGMPQNDADPRASVARLLGAFAERMSDPANLAVLKLVIREAMTDPELAAFYRAEVIDRALPALATALANGMAAGKVRRLDPALTVRTVIGPFLMHVLLDEVFGVRPEGGLGLDRLVANHTEILMAGLAPEGDG